eukprot:896301-Amphidinium_carterae.1
MRDAASTLEAMCSSESLTSRGWFCLHLREQLARATAIEWRPRFKLQDKWKDPAVMLGLAAANRSAIDAPQWYFVDNKCELHKLLSEAHGGDFWQGAWPASFVLPDDAATAEAYVLGNTQSAWWLKAAHGHGGHRNKLLSTADVKQHLRGGSGSPMLLQEDVSDCVRLAGKRFSLRLYVIVLESSAGRQAFLSTEGLVYLAHTDGAVASNASQAALQSQGSADAAGAPAAPSLKWLQTQSAFRDVWDDFWARTLDLATHLWNDALLDALDRPLGEMSSSKDRWGK